MVTLCWAAKGGSGTTVVASAIALTSDRPSLLVDLDGEIPAVLGLPEPDRPGVAEWLASDATPEHLGDLLIDIAPRTSLLPWRASSGAGGVRMAGAHGGVEVSTHDVRDSVRDVRDSVRDIGAERDRWAMLADWLHDWSDQWGCDVTIDAGTRTPPEQLRHRAGHSLLVTRPCYLALRRAVHNPVRPTGVVLVDVPGHGLGSRDFEHALGVPVEAVVSLDPMVARAVDAGLLTSRLPRVMSRALRRVAA